MLQDRKLKSFIFWADSNESFYVNPTADFGKLLAYVCETASRRC